MGGFGGAGPERNNANNAEAKRYRDKIDASRCVIHHNMNIHDAIVATSLIRRLRSSAVREAATERYTFGSRTEFWPETGTLGFKNGYTLKPSKNHTPGALRLASLTTCLFSA